MPNKNKLSIYLIKDEFSHSDSLIVEDVRHKILDVETLGTVYYSPSNINKPKWVNDFFCGKIDNDDIFTSNARVVMIARVKIEDVMKALDYYISKTNRRVTIEYIMLAGINDSDECACELANLVKGKLMYVNLIPYNETTHFELKRSNDFKIKSFYDILKSNNVNVTIRKEMGGNLSAACGQLRANAQKE